MGKHGQSDTRVLTSARVATHSPSKFRGIKCSAFELINIKTL